MTYVGGKVTGTGRAFYSRSLLGGANASEVRRERKRGDPCVSSLSDLLRSTGDLSNYGSDREGTMKHHQEAAIDIFDKTAEG